MRNLSTKRVFLFYGLLIISFLLLIGRLLELQLFLGARYRALAEENRIKKEVVPAPRGVIYDRNNEPLVRNKPVYRLKEKDKEEYKIISREEALRIEVAGGEEATRLRMDIGRDYLYSRFLAHVLGYLGEATKEEVEDRKWQSGDLVGRTGIEEEYEEILRGQDGGEIYEVDTSGNRIREMGQVEPLSGRDLHLSIDTQLSKVAFQALKTFVAEETEPVENRRGAVVVTNAKTGQVLVLVSFPSYNPNQITPENLVDEEKPMFNRAISGLYPPGSTFKIVTVVAGLEEERIDRWTIYEDVGEIRIGEYVYRNWYYIQYGRTEGEINLVWAIKRSTDTFFYKIGEWVGVNKLGEWGRAFGLGQKSNIDLPGEAMGLVPTPKWKEETLGEKWFLGNTYHLAIGQADLLTTPLQVNMVTSVIANDGRLCLPQVKKQEKKKCQDLKLKSETLKLVREGMKEACSTGGTAFPFFDFSPRVACKTGTAQFGDPEERTHAWLTAFAPIDNPEIVVTVLVEAGGEGSRVAAPIVKEVMEAWFYGR